LAWLRKNFRKRILERDTRKGGREEKEGIMVGRIKNGKDLKIIENIREWRNGEEIRRVEGMAGGVEGRSENDN